MSIQLIQASAHDTGLPDQIAHCAIQSPPYFGLRKYSGEQDVAWTEVQYAPMVGLPPFTIPAMRAALGNEPTIEAYIGHLLLVAREQYRILRNDGLSFWNVGDSFARDGGTDRKVSATATVGSTRNTLLQMDDRTQSAPAGIPAKNMLMVPHRFALAMQADGWILRSAMPWIKANPLPESCLDRPTTSIEYIFMFAKQERYFYDAEAVKMPVADASIGRAQRKQNLMDRVGQGVLNSKQITDGVDSEHGYAGLALGRNGKTGYDIEGGRLFRSSDPFFQSWQGMLLDDDNDPLAMIVNPKGYAGSHFATYPTALVEPLIRAGSSVYGVCVKCKAPWERVVERTAMIVNKTQRNQDRGTRTGCSGTMVSPATSETTGWQPTCACHCPDVEPATVVDFFNGSGTTGRAALKLNRSYIGIDVCSEYLSDLSPARLSNVQIEMALG